MLNSDNLFVDRKEELESLNRLYGNTQSTFAVIYGSRRVGKSSLINEFLKGKKSVYYLATASSEHEQLQALARDMGGAIGNKTLQNFGVTGWDMLFSEISNYRGGKKLALAIDEFPYLIKMDNAIPSIFQAGWDRYLAKANIMLILSGSSIGMMRDQFLNYSAPLYGRTNGAFNLRPLKFRYIARMIPDLSITDKLYAYFIFGGIPAYYVPYFSLKSINEMIDAIVKNGSPFITELSLLLSDEVKKDSKFIEILTLIAEGINKPNEIATKAHILQSNLYYYLDVLGEIDMIMKDFPVTATPKLRSKSSSYVIKNPFVYFWAVSLRRARQQLEEGNASGATREIRSTLDIIAQKRFEDLSKEIVIELSGNEMFKVQRIGRWWGSGPRAATGNNQEEIDTVALNENTKEILFAECKWSDDVDTDIFFDLKRKATVVAWNSGTRKEHYALFARSFSKRMKALAKIENVALFDLEKIDRIFGEHGSNSD